uniref:NADH dehydrogenase subunit 6 n=1 Tax=Neomaskellia andropogonis TaxID=266944 RepID=Q697F9_NEOAD|nr:NADH dehydrogenase subunit 6 [Neomaskellia andropogonis]
MYFNPLILLIIFCFYLIFLVIMLSYYLKLYFYSYIIFLIFMSGLIITLMYVSSVIINEKLYFNVKYIMMFFIFGLMFLMLDKVFLIHTFSFFYLNNLELISLMKFFSYPMMCFFFFFVVYLFFLLILVYEILKKSKGPLRVMI